MKKAIKKERLNLYIDPKIFALIKKEAEKNSRTKAGQVMIWVKERLKIK